jgi:DNA-binding IscR family transcriptional regulator
MNDICLVHPVWREVQSKIVSILDGVTFEELARKAATQG